jgi:hypothetical protein
MNKFILSEYTGISYLKEMKSAGVITEILLKMVLNTINLNLIHAKLDFCFDFLQIIHGRLNFIKIYVFALSHNVISSTPRYKRDSNIKRYI